MMFIMNRALSEWSDKDNGMGMDRINTNEG